MPRQPSFYSFAGGLNTNSAALAVPPGAVISSYNYEPLAEGYGRVDGYERYDGQIAPSQASFQLLSFDTGANPINSGDTVTGQSSGASGTLIDEVIDFAGSWDDGTASGTLLLSGVTGEFENDELLNVGGAPHATVDGTASVNLADTEDLRRTYARAAIQWQRSRIAKVPGEGPVRGVAVHDGAVYAFRDVVGGAYSRAYKATATGWEALGFLRRMNFTGSGLLPLLGDTVTGATSGATGVVTNVIQTTGDVAQGTASGFVDLASITGTFAGSETINGADGRLFIGTGPNVMRIAAGGRFRTRSHNFYGAADRYRFYGANGTGQAFEVLPEGIALISTGMEPDEPQRIFEVGNHLGLTFPGGSIQFSGTGEPHAWQVVLGAGEIGFGTEITDIVEANETAVAIFGEQKIAVLQGNDTANFVLDTLTTEAGADPDTAQRISRTVYVDKRGLRDLTATQAFGNFKTGALSGLFERYFKIKRAAGAAPIGSYLSRVKSQYRLVWDDNTALTVYMGGKTPEAMVSGFGDVVPFCFGQGEVPDGEGIFIGGEDGYVYRMDSGHSFDGDRIKGFVMTPFNNFGNPERDDRFFKVILELDSPAAANIGITVQYDYGDGYQPISGERDFTAQGGAGDFLVSGGGGLFDTAIWDQFYWSAPVEARAEADIDGIGRNASFIFATNAEIDEPAHILQAYIVHHSQRKLRR